MRVICSPARGPRATHVYLKSPAAFQPANAATNAPAPSFSCGTPRRSDSLGTLKAPVTTVKRQSPRLASTTHLRELWPCSCQPATMRAAGSWGQ